MTKMLTDYPKKCDIPAPYISLAPSTITPPTPHNCPQGAQHATDTINPQTGLVINHVVLYCGDEKKKGAQYWLALLGRDAP